MRSRFATLLLCSVLPCCLANWTKDWTLQGDASIQGTNLTTNGIKRHSTAYYHHAINLKAGKRCLLEWEYSLTRPVKWGLKGGNQALELLNGPCHVKIWGGWPYLNHDTLARHPQQCGRRYRMSLLFSKDYIFSWKIDGQEQLNDILPVPNDRKQQDDYRLRIGDGPTGGGKTVWHHIAIATRPPLSETQQALQCFTLDKRQEQASFSVGINRSTDKVSLSPMHYQGTIDNTITLAIPKGGTKSFQLTVIPRNVVLKKVRIRRLPSDDVITMESFLLGYIKLGNFTLNNSPFGAYYPDALMPPSPRDIHKDLVQPYWFDVTVPELCKLRRHESVLCIQTDNAGERRLKLIVNVLNYTLPRRNPVVTALSFNPGSLERCYHPEESRKLYGISDRGSHNAMYNLKGDHPLENGSFWRPLYRRLLAYRINPASIYSDGLAGGGDFRVVPDMEDITYAYKLGLNAVCLGCTRYLPEDSAQRSAYLKKIQHHLRTWENFIRSHDFRDITWYWHGFDESELQARRNPAQGRKTDRDILQLANFFKKDFPWLKLETANEFIPRHRQHFQIWTPRPFDLQAQTENTADFWMYVACGPNKPYANFFLENPGSDPRTFGWQIALRQPAISGFLYYRLFKEIYPADWQKNTTPFPFVPLDPRVLEVNGDGILAYPGPDNHLYFSTRLANFRDGMQDLTALKLLQSRTETLPDQHPLKIQATTLHNQCRKIIRDWTSYSENGQDYDNLREQLDRLLEQLQEAAADKTIIR